MKHTPPVDHFDEQQAASFGYLTTIHQVNLTSAYFLYISRIGMVSVIACRSFALSSGTGLLSCTGGIGFCI